MVGLVPVVVVGLLGCGGNRDGVSVIPGGGGFFTVPPGGGLAPAAVAGVGEEDGEDIQGGEEGYGVHAP